VERLRAFGEQRDGVEELDDGAGPAVREHQRHRVRMRGADVQEVDAEAVELGAELR
jgi:hypothetical protein